MEMKNGVDRNSDEGVGVEYAMTSADDDGREQTRRAAPSWEMRLHLGPASGERARAAGRSHRLATATVGDATEVDRPAAGEHQLTALLHAHEGTTAIAVDHKRVPGVQGL
ncbi:hypothetical protein ACLQ3C_16965 [Gordonia sp. DT30]|uniref:hypothetical protein n=1 Tax=Gordonia sp. DT30 TaxID=3416546 RepID=UPI003CEA72BC